MANLGKKDLLKYSPYISWQKDFVENFVYIYNHKSKKWLYLNDIARDIWEFLEIKAQTQEDIINEILKRYNVEYERASGDIRELIKRLLDEEVLIVENEEIR